jgi:hypothetical protein
MTYEEAVECAREHLTIEREVAATPTGMSVCFDRNLGTWRTFSANAWDHTEERPTLPWSPPLANIEPREWLRPDGVLVPWAERSVQP